ncbi:MAG TPA: TrkA C-terminal domain-containing protein, partial [Methanocorpusculum sp.]|nr:TrkA C-terminal domain-containing protein [Methanocorpusculum sp.]
LNTIRLHFNQEKDAPNSATTMDQIIVGKNSEVVDQTISKLDLRKKYSISIIAIQSGKESRKVITSPNGNTKLKEGDTVVVIGNTESINIVKGIFSEKPPT